MHPSRRHRLIAALVAVVALLCSQLAMAGYDCPAQHERSMAERMAAGLPCTGMDPGQPSLCHAHAAATPLSAEVAKAPALSLPRVVLVLVQPRVLYAAEATARAVVDPPQARPPPDPLFLATRRVRV